MTELEQAKQALTEKRAEYEALSKDVNEKHAKLAANRELLAALDKQLATAVQSRKTAADVMVKGVESDDYIKQCRAAVYELREEKEVTQELVDAYERSLRDAPKKLSELSTTVYAYEMACWQSLCKELQSEIAHNAEPIRKAWAARIGAGGANSFETLGKIICGAVRSEEAIQLGDAQLNNVRADLAKEHGL